MELKKARSAERDAVHVRAAARACIGIWPVWVAIWLWWRGFVVGRDSVLDAAPQMFVATLALVALARGISERLRLLARAQLAEGGAAESPNDRHLVPEPEPEPKFEPKTEPELERERELAPAGSPGAGKSPAATTQIFANQLDSTAQRLSQLHEGLPPEPGPTLTPAEKAGKSSKPPILHCPTQLEWTGVELGQRLSQKLTLTNLSTERDACYKIKTTCVGRYAVLPGQALIPAGQSVEVEIVLLKMDELPEPASLKDRFLIQAAWKDDPLEEVTAFWNRGPAKSQLFQKKFSSELFLPDQASRRAAEARRAERKAKEEADEAEAKRQLVAIPATKRQHCAGYPGWEAMSWNQRLFIARNPPEIKAKVVAKKVETVADAEAKRAAEARRKVEAERKAEEEAAAAEREARVAAKLIELRETDDEGAIARGIREGGGWTTSRSPSLCSTELQAAKLRLILCFLHSERLTEHCPLVLMGGREPETIAANIRAGITPAGVWRAGNGEIAAALESSELTVLPS